MGTECARAFRRKERKLELTLGERSDPKVFDPMRDIPAWSKVSGRDREEVCRLLSLGENVQAIRYYRQAAGLDLAEAKEAIEMLLAYDPPKPVIPETKSCPYCGAPLRTPVAQQCFACGADWHPKPASKA